MEQNRINGGMGMGMGSGAAPYPSLDNVVPDVRFAGAVAPMMAEELSDISEYIYQYLIFAEAMPELAEFFEELSMTEMMHYELLGKLLYKLGVNPAIRTRIQNVPIDITDDTPSKAPVAAKRALERDMRGEQNSAREYARLAEAATSSDAAALLRRLSADEENHARRISQILKG